jgi:hypothetical protein
MANKGASLLPNDFAVGGALPNGEYTIAASKASTFDYNGTQPASPALHITFADADGEAREQYYSAGKLEFLAPDVDGRRFINPNGDDAKISKQSNAAAFLISIINAGFPVDKLGDDVTVFAGTKVLIENVAQQKREGLKDQKEGKTIPLVAKIISLSGEAKSGARGAAKIPVTATPKTAASPASSNGNLDEAAITAIQEILAETPDNSLTKLKLGTQVMLKLSKAHDPNLNAIKKLATDSVWLAAQAEAGGWVSDGNTIKLG